MFTIVISEKGGAERRETFEKTELNVGRVQGNDLILSKGNVSKHHARLLVRDSRFVVTDLKSTNGTYVNGRKIAQATVVRDGDKIYVGDFVLRLESGDAPQSVAPGGSAELEDSTSRSQARTGVGSRPPPLVTTATSGVRGSAPPSSSAPPPMIGQVRAAPSRFPGPPRVPQRTEPKMVTGAVPTPAAQASSVPPPLRSSAPPPPAPVRSTPPPPPLRSSAPPPPQARLLPPRTAEEAARQADLVALVDRLARAVDLSVLDREPVVGPEMSARLEAAVRELIAAMVRDKALSEGCDVERLSRDALRELVGLGSLETLLSDDSVVDAYLSSSGRLLAENASGQTVAIVPSFSGSPAVARAVFRLAHRSGEPRRDGEAVIERRLPGGAQLWAFSPPIAREWAVALRKPRRVELSLADLVRAGALSKSIATFLEACVAAYVNVLVVGLGSAQVAGMLSALAAAVPPGERLIVLQDTEAIGVGQAQAISLMLGDRGTQALECVRAASRFGADRLLVASLAGPMGAATIDAIGEGTEGVLAGLGAPSLRHALARLTSHVALSRPGASIDAAREAIAGAFDVLVEVAKPEGRLRVLRVAEVVGTDDRGIGSRDLFVYRPDAAGAAGEAAYVVTGTSPRFSADVVARGGRIDPAMFRRK